MRAMRCELMSRGLAPQGIKTLDQDVHNSKNAFGGNILDKKKIAEKFQLPSKGEVLYFAGCYPFFRDPEKRAEKTLLVLRNAKINVSFLAEKEWCCGILQYANGNEELCKEMAMHNLEVIKASGAEIVITSCSGCFHALKHVYPRVVQEEPFFQVLHTSQYFSQLIEDKLLEFKHEVPLTVTYHDPCHLGRMCKIYDEPRKLINHIPGITLVEMARIREKAWCCGGGEGIVSLLYPKLAAGIGNERILEAQATGASSLVTACPHCIAQLTFSAKRSKIQLPCMDIAELLASAL